MTDTHDHSALAHAAADAIAQRTGVARHDVAITLGSGWRNALEVIGDVVAEIPADEIPGFRPPSVDGHTGVLTSIRLSSGRHVLAIGARTHLYEGHGVAPVAHSVRTAAATGVTVMILTNGAGGINRSYTPGQVVLISDHINFTARSPLTGAAFIDLTDLYSARLRGSVRRRLPELVEGVYVQFPGPQYETPAEIRMFATLGGDLVGMSTAIEAIAAREERLEVLGLSLVTNHAAGIQPTALDHQEVMDAGVASVDTLRRVLSHTIRALESDLHDDATGDGA